MNRLSILARIVISTIASGVIFYSTCTASDYVNQTMGIKQIELLQKLVMNKNLLPTYILTDNKFYEISEKYIDALIEEVFSFELLPNKELDTFIHIIAHINNDADICKFEFSGHNITITVASDNKDDLDEIYLGLKFDEYFSKVSYTYTKGEEEIIYHIYCEPKKLEPKLNIEQAMNIFRQ